MMKTCVLIALIFNSSLVTEGQAQGRPDTVVVQSGAYKLRGLLWRPVGSGPFPAVLFNHGSGQGIPAASGDRDEHDFVWQAETLAPAFVRHGYVFCYLFRRGTGLSADQGLSSSERWEKELSAKGEAARNAMQLQLLQTDDLTDGLAGVAYLRALPTVDTRRVAVAGHSFGGQIAMLLAEHDSTLRAIVAFAPAAASWGRSALLRDRLRRAVARTVVPIFFLFAANDYSTEPGQVLAAEMQRLGKVHRLRIYPAVGKTAPEGHGFVHLRVATWEPDVFGFLDEHLRQ